MSATLTAPPPAPPAIARRLPREEAAAAAAAAALWRRRGLTLASLAVFFSLWQLSGLVLNQLLISTPVEVAKAEVQILSEGYLIRDLLEGFREMYIGWGAAIVVGISAGLLMGRYRFMERVLGLYVDLMNGTPGIALVPLMIIWLGLGLRTRVVFIFFVTLWPMLLNSVVGVKNVSRGYIEVGQTFGLNESQLMWKIAIPAAIPYILAGLRISAGRAVIALIIGQIEVASVGLGKLLLDLGMSFQTPKFFAVFMVTATLGIVNVTIIRWVQKSWFPWVEATSAAAR